MDYNPPTEILLLQCSARDGGAETDRAGRELFRRALEDSDDRALNHIYHIYLPQVRVWILSDSLFPRRQEEAGDFACDTLAAFFRACAGAAFAQRFPVESGLAPILGYLRKCARSQLWMYWRTKKRRPTDEWPENDTVEDANDLRPERELAMLYRHILERVLTTDRDRLCFRVFFILGWDPRHVPSRFPDLASTDEEARLLKTKLIKLLRGAGGSDPFLNEWLDE